MVMLIKVVYVALFKFRFVLKKLVLSALTLPPRKVFDQPIDVRFFVHLSSY